nr:hypothetical protein [Tanacetum cinerariifolium]
MCKKCLISVNHDECLRNYVNGKYSRGKKQKAKVSFKENQKKYQPKVKKPNKVGFLERLATPKLRKPRFLLRWSPTGRLFNQKGNIVDSSESESQFDCSNGNNTCTSNTLEPKIKQFPNSTSLLGRNDHVAVILGFGDLQWGNILITRVYFIKGLGHNLFAVGQFCLLKFKYNKENFCPFCEQGKSKRASHPPKQVPNSRQRLHLLHMDLYGPIRIASINGKRYVLVIVDDYSRYTWVHFIRSKNKAPEVIKTFLKRITVLLQSPVIIIRTDNGIEFKNQVLKEYFDSVDISHQMSSVRTPQQNGVVERQNRTLVEAARTIKPDISFLHVFGALCYPKNDREDIGKLGAKGLDLTYAPSTITTQQLTEGELDLLFEAMYDDYISGFIDADHPCHVYKLKKALYGLKQASRAWYDELSTFLLQNHFFKGTIDPTLFIRRFHDDILVPLQKVDDGGNDIFPWFTSKPIPLWHLYKPVQIRVRNPEKYGMESYNPVGTPMEIKDKLDLDQNGTPVDATKYRSMIGALMYLASSRPNIVYTTCLCARYQAKPTEKHLKEVKRIFRYLRGAVNTGLCYTKDSGFELTGFSDADYAGCKDTFKSTSGGAQFLGEKLYKWKAVCFGDCGRLLLLHVEWSSRRRNRTLVEAARTMLIFSRAPLFLWAKAIATAGFTQNRSIITIDREDIGKLGAKGDIGFFIGYSADSCAYRVYNR